MEESILEKLKSHAEKIKMANKINHSKKLISNPERIGQTRILAF